jgi:hypothetical protein
MAIALRILFLAVAVGIWASGLLFSFFPPEVYFFVTRTLEYQEPPGFFSFSLAGWVVAWTMLSMLWISASFGAIGKRVDYILILGLFALSSLSFYYTENMTWLVYSGLVGATLLGALIGFGFKSFRQKFLKIKN